MNGPRVTKIMWASLTMLVLLGCATITPHENFTKILTREVGRSIDEVSASSWVRPGQLIDSTVLPNGNWANRYKYYRGTCIYTLEVSPVTRRIVGVSFVGSESDCVVNP